MLGYHPISDQPISSLAVTSSTNTYIITPSGGVVFSGTASFIKEKVIIPTGGVTFSGTGIEVHGKIFTVSGGVSFGGTGSITSNAGGGGTTTPERTKVGIGT